MAVQALIVNPDEEASPKQRRPSQRRRTSGTVVSGQPLTRPEGYAYSSGCIIEPWVPVEGYNATSKRRLVRSLQDRQAYIPEMFNEPSTFIALIGGVWRRFLLLEEWWQVRTIHALHGPRGPQREPCSACGWFFESKEAVSVMVGTSSATRQEFNICPDCQKEGVLDATRKSGCYVAVAAVNLNP